MVAPQKFIKELMKSLSLLSIRLLWLITWFWSKKTQANIVLGRSFLRSVGAFIDVKKGCIRFRFPIKGRFSFPLKDKEVLIEGKNAFDPGKT